MQRGQRNNEEDQNIELVEIMLMCASKDEFGEDASLTDLHTFLKKKTFRFNYLVDGANSFITSVLVELCDELKIDEAEMATLREKSKENEKTDEDIFLGVMSRHLTFGK